MKLPAICLLDVICKTVVEPYARLFAPLVVKLFLDIYERVHQNGRNTLEQMLLTWRCAAPNGRELFGSGPQYILERRIWGSSQQDVDSPHHENAISAVQVLSELDFALNQKKYTLQENPFDAIALNHITVLEQLRLLVQSGVSQEELMFVSSQLRNLAPQPTQRALLPASVSWVNQPQTNTSTAQSASFPVYINQSQYPTQYPSGLAPSRHPLYEIPLVDPSLTTQSISVNPRLALDIANVITTLKKAGIVPATVSEAPPLPLNTEAADNKSRDVAWNYRKAILAQGMKLNADILKRKAPMTDFLFKHHPNQCKQCGVRFAEGPEGTKKMCGHIDMHIELKREAAQGSKRGYSRGWFLSAEDWKRSSRLDVKGKGRAHDLPRPTSLVGAEASIHEADLNLQYVTVPPGDEIKSVLCPICKDAMDCEFVEDDEEWVWKNAVKKSEKLYHATCYAEVSASRLHSAERSHQASVGSTRTMSRTPGKAPHSTPEVQRMNLAGTKRRMDTRDEDEGEARPAKRPMLSPVLS